MIVGDVKVRETVVQSPEPELVQTTADYYHVRVRPKEIFAE
jgi:hypothetical protein